MRFLLEFIREKCASFETVFFWRNVAEMFGSQSQGMGFVGGVVEWRFGLRLYLI